jgi:tRNA-intron endonuclease
VITENKQIFSKFFYGNEKNDIVSLSLVESLYLSEKGFMDVYVNNKAISRSELNELGKKIEYNFEDRYQVYKNLKNRNFSVKTGFKFGSDFRVYDEIKGIEDLPHSKYLISVVGDEKMPLYQIAGSVRLAQNVRKKMIFAFKERGEINYLLIEWVKV